MCPWLRSETSCAGLPKSTHVNNMRPRLVNHFWQSLTKPTCAAKTLVWPKGELSEPTVSVEKRPDMQTCRVRSGNDVDGRPFLARGRRRAARVQRLRVSSARSSSRSTGQGATSASSVLERPRSTPPGAYVTQIGGGNRPVPAQLRPCGERLSSHVADHSSPKSVYPPPASA